MTEKQKSYVTLDNKDITFKAVNSYMKFGDVKYEKQKTCLTEEEKDKIWNRAHSDIISINIEKTSKTDELSIRTVLQRAI